jgi:hypothetical protein
MKIKEVIVEGSPAKIAKRLQQSTVGLNLFRDAEFADRIYELNRVMMAAAMADGSDNMIDMDEKSWIGKRRGAYPYTPEEDKMLKQAFRAAGATYTDLNQGDMNSQELESTNKASPVRAFQGYPR